MGLVRIHVQVFGDRGRAIITDLALDGRVAFQGLHIFFYFGFGLLDAFFESPALNKEVGNRKNADGNRDVRHKAHQQRANDRI